MKCVKFALLIALAMAADGLVAIEGDARLPGGADDESLLSVEEGPAMPPIQLTRPASLEPTRPEIEVPVPEVAAAAAAGPRARRRRSTVVFRPLFATRERDAERREQQQRRRGYWQGEQRRRAAAGGQQYRPAYPAAYPANYPAPAAWGR